jgi:DNA-binding transcriptional ArsR family regulator
MDDMLRALADGTRRQILTLVLHEERTAGDIAARFAMSRPGVSQHLGVLLDSKLISVRREGTRRIYRANLKTMARLRAELATIWDESLLRLKSAAEAAGHKGKRR